MKHIPDITYTLKIYDIIFQYKENFVWNIYNMYLISEAIWHNSSVHSQMLIRLGKTLFNVNKTRKTLFNVNKTQKTLLNVNYTRKIVLNVNNTQKTEPDQLSLETKIKWNMYTKEMTCETWTRWVITWNQNKMKYLYKANDNWKLYFMKYQNKANDTWNLRWTLGVANYTWNCQLCLCVPLGETEG